MFIFVYLCYSGIFFVCLVHSEIDLIDHRNFFYFLSNSQKGLEKPQFQAQ